jgi:hypothetical protein
VLGLTVTFHFAPRKKIMAFSPLKLLKEDTMTVFFLVLMGYVVLTLADDRFAGGKLNAFVRSKVG